MTARNTHRPKWRDDRAFGWHEVNELRSKATRLAGVGPSAPIVGVSRAGFDAGREALALALEPADLMRAWSGA